MWWRSIWKLTCHLKTRILIWLDLANRLLTWDNGHKINMMGPNRCRLRKMNEESMNHLFEFCSFFKAFWMEVTKSLGIKEKWDKGGLEESMLDWITNKAIVVA